MLRRITVFILTLAIATAAIAQDSPTAAELERRVRELEERIRLLTSSTSASPTAQLTEIQRQIEVLSTEIEALKTRQTDTQPVADQSTFGLGSAASKVYRAKEGISFGGYGEAIYQNLAKRNDNGNRVTSRDTADLLRIILYTGYKFSDRVIFNSELEVEHAYTSLGGEVEVEFAYLDYLVRPNLGIRSGLVLIPMGFTNELHEPTTFLGSRRTLVDRSIIPTTWRELGVGAFGDNGPIAWRAYLVTGMNASRFTSAGIRGGRGSGAQALAEDFALTGRLDWSPVEGSTIGASAYSGNSGQGAIVAGEELEARVTLWDVHAETRFRGVWLRGVFARGTIDDAARINVQNNLTGANGVGEGFGGWYAEAGYDLAALRGFGERSITPFVRYERLDTHRGVPTGFTRNRALDQTIKTFGVQWKPIAQTVVKADYQNVDNAAGTGTNQWNLAIGYIF